MENNVQKKKTLRYKKKGFKKPPQTNYPKNTAEDKT